VCEDVAIINEGRVVVAGDLDDVRNRSAKRRLTVDVDGRPWIPDWPGVEVVDGPGPDHCIVDDDAPIEAFLTAASAVGTVNRFLFEPPRLTDLFREAVKT